MSEPAVVVSIKSLCVALKVLKHEEKKLMALKEVISKEDHQHLINVRLAIRELEELMPE